MSVCTNYLQITCKQPAILLQKICSKNIANYSDKYLSAINSSFLPSDASLFEQTCFCLSSISCFVFPLFSQIRDQILDYNRLVCDSFFRLVTMKEVVKLIMCLSAACKHEKVSNLIICKHEKVSKHIICLSAACKHNKVSKLIICLSPACIHSFFLNKDQEKIFYPWMSLRYNKIEGKMFLICPQFSDIPRQHLTLSLNIKKQ